ncbi:MAG: hypothetical protein ACM3MG_05800 [Bacillota bacterium]
MKSYLKYPLLLALTAGTLSCMKQPDLAENDTPATLEAVQNSLVDAWGTVSPLTMLKGDFVYQETEQTIDTLDPKLVLQEGITVSNITETSTEYDYTFLYQAAVIKGDNASQSTREDHRSVVKNTTASDPTSALTPNNLSEAALKVAQLNLHKLSSIKTMADDLQMTLGFERLIMLAQSCKMTDQLQKYCQENLKVDSCEIKCSNLNATSETRPAPDLMKAQPNCGGLPNCQMNVKNVSFDWSILLKTGNVTEKQKVTYTLSMTQDLPFLSRVLDYCSRGLVQIPNSSTKVLVTVCNKLKNFKRTAN